MEAGVGQTVLSFLVVERRRLVIEIHDLPETRADARVVFARNVVGHRVSNDEKALIRHHRVRFLDLDRQTALRFAQVLDAQDAAVVETHGGGIRLPHLRIGGQIVTFHLSTGFAED